MGQQDLIGATVFLLVWLTVFFYLKRRPRSNFSGEKETIMKTKDQILKELPERFRTFGVPSLCEDLDTANASRMYWYCVAQEIDEMRAATVKDFTAKINAMQQSFEKDLTVLRSKVDAAEKVAASKNVPQPPPTQPIQELKTVKPFFQQIWLGKKRHEIRSTHDRTFRVGETIILRETEGLDYTGRAIKIKITYLSDNCLIGSGHVIFSFKRIARIKGYKTSDGFCPC
jgi:hypothetical protein